MISLITGKVKKNSFGKDPWVEVLTSGGVGYRLYVSTKFLFLEPDLDIEIHTSFQVRDDSQTLYGFNTREEKDFFEQLISVSGIGPKIGLAILSTYTREEIEEIIKEGDSKKLSKVSGLGSKGAQKIILDLRGKIDFEQEDKIKEEKEILKDLKGALKALGYSGSILDSSMKYAEDRLDENDDMEIEDLVKYVLQK